MKTRTLLRNRLSDHIPTLTDPQGKPGQAALLVALMMVGLLAFAGLVFDGGNAYAQRRHAQNAADAAAFAGTRVLAEARVSYNPGRWGAADDCAVLYAVDSYAKMNGITGSTLNSSCGGSASPNLKAYYIVVDGDAIVVGNGFIPADVAAVSVTVKSTFNTLFLKIVNEHIGEVSAAAQAKFGYPLGGSFIPLTVNIHTLDRGGKCDPGVTPATLCRLQGDTTGPGNFQWLDFNQTNGSSSAKCLTPNVPTLRGWLTPPPNNTKAPPLNMGDFVCGTPGKNGNPFSTEKAAWFALPDSKRLWTIPLYDQVVGTGNVFHYRVAGFATFQLVSWNNGDIEAKFVTFASPGKNDGNGWCPGGTCAISLSQ